MAPEEPLTPGGLGQLVQAPVWLVLLLAGSGVGWTLRPATDPDYVSKIELIEKLEEKLDPMEKAAEKLADQGAARGYEIRALEARIRALEIAVEHAHGRGR